MKGSPPTSGSDLGLRSVIGRSRVASPPARIATGKIVSVMTVRRVVDTIHDFEIRRGVFERPTWWRTRLNATNEVVEFNPPGLVGARELACGRLGRPHLRQHAVVRKAFSTVTPA